MTNLTKEEYARLHLKAKRGMLTAEERAALEAYEAAAQPAPQTPVPADTETLLCCPYCGHATITTQIVSDVTYRKPATVIAMMFAPLIAVVLAFLLRNMFVTVLALIVVIVSALVPMWAFYRGNYSVTHKYYVCKRCGYAERDTKWKIVNDGGKAIEAVAMGIGLTLVLIFSVFMISKNADAERLAMEARRIGVNVNQIARTLNAEAKGRGGMLRSDTLNGCEKGLEEVRGELSKLAREVETLRQDFGSDMFSALMYSDDPGRLRRLVNYWFGMGGDA